MSRRAQACARCCVSWSERELIGSARSSSGTCAAASAEPRSRATASRPGATAFRRARQPLAILQQLIDGRVVLEQVTIVEGWTFAQMRKAAGARKR